jgi:hypothetical protein
LDLGSGLSAIPEAAGPAPILYASNKSATSVSPTSDGNPDADAAADSDQENDQEVPAELDFDEDGSQQAITTVGQVKFKQMVASGVCDVAEPGAVGGMPVSRIWGHLNRDVEWM